MWDDAYNRPLAVNQNENPVDRSLMVDPLSYFSFQPMLHDWYNKGPGMYHSVCGMVHIKEPLLLIGKSILCGGSRFPFSLSEWSFTICLMPYNRKYNVLSASLNNFFFSFLLCYLLILPFCLWIGAYKRSFAVNQKKNSPCSGRSRFPLSYCVVI